MPSGCGCRSGNELAHPDCRAKLARFQHAHRGSGVWSSCPTCRRPFGGEMRNLLAIAWVQHATNPLQPLHWFAEQHPAVRSALHLSCDLVRDEQYAAAERVTRAILRPIRSLVGTRDILYAQCVVDMALSQSFVGKFAASNLRFAMVIRTLASVYGLGDWMTHSVRLQYAASLVRQLRTTASHQPPSIVLRAIRRVFGELHVSNMASCIAHLNASLALIMNATDHLPITTRVFDGMSKLAASLSLHGLFTDAMSIHTALLEAHERVLGPFHPQTVDARDLRTACNVARALHARGAHRVHLPSVHRSVHECKLHQKRRAAMLSRRRSAGPTVTRASAVRTSVRQRRSTVPANGVGNSACTDHDSYVYTYTYKYTYGVSSHQTIE